MPPKPKCECGECSTCKTRADNQRWRSRNPERARELRVASYYRHASKRRAYSTAYYQEHREKILDHYSTQRPQRTYKNPPEKTRAQMAAWLAVQHGELVPQPCEGCGKAVYETRDGRRGVHAHHDDYSKPLEVRWLCYACHGKEHRRYE